MGAALVEPVVESPKIIAESLKTSSSAAPAKVQPERVEPEAADPHPLVPVFLIGGMALIGALAFVASIMIWLALSYSGVLAP
jgi:hypothetical protein